MQSDPHCYWCGREVRVAGPDSSGHFPPDMATVDHLYSRLHPHRKNGGKGVRVLACYECNHDRGKAENHPDRLGTWQPRRTEASHESSDS